MSKFREDAAHGWEIELSFDEAEAFAELFGEGLEFATMVEMFLDRIAMEDEEE